MDKNNNNKRYTKRDLESERWRGTVSQSLVDITKTVTETNRRLNHFDKRLNKLQIKVAGIGAVAALVVSVLVAFFAK